MRKIKLEKAGQELMISTPSGLLAVVYDARGTKVIAVKSSARSKKLFIELISDDKVGRNIEGDRAVLFIREKDKVNLGEISHDQELKKIIEDYMKDETKHVVPIP